MRQLFVPAGVTRQNHPHDASRERQNPRRLMASVREM